MKLCREEDLEALRVNMTYFEAARFTKSIQDMQPQQQTQLMPEQTEPESEVQPEEFVVE
jgi:hypothetical protein